MRSELSLSTRLVDVTPALVKLAEASGEQSLHRQDETYRLALNGIHARLAQTAKLLVNERGDVRREISAIPYTSAEALLADMNVIAESLQSQQGEALIYPRLGKLIKAIETFGFHLATVDLRQSSDVHELVIKELFLKAGQDFNYATLDEDEKVEVLLEELKQPRLLFSPFQQYSELVQSEMEVLQKARGIRAGYGKRAIRQYIISHTETLSDLLEVALLQKETGMLRGVWGSAKVQMDLNLSLIHI